MVGGCCRAKVIRRGEEYRSLAVARLERRSRMVGRKWFALGLEVTLVLGLIHPWMRAAVIVERTIAIDFRSANGMKEVRRCVG